MKISIIVPSYNSSSTISYTIDAILPQAQQLDAEILIVDSSDDGMTENVIKKYLCEHLRIIKSGVKVMPAIQRNIGAARAAGELLIFLDSDVIPCSDLIQQFYESYKSGYYAGCGSLTIAPFQLKKRIVSAQYYLQLKDFLPAGKPRVKGFPAGASTFCSKDIFHKVGGYPEIRVAEDVIFGSSINKFTELWFFPDASAAHIFREDENGFYASQKMRGRYAALYRKKTGKMPALPSRIAVVLYPVFLLIKLYRVMVRTALTGPQNTFRLLRASSLCLAGLHHWTLGFIDGAMEKVNDVYPQLN